MFQKIKAWCKRFWGNLKSSLPVTAVMTALWLVLGWLRSFGVHSALLFPLNFLTGALAGLDGGSLIGGTLGKAVLLIIVNSFVRSLLLHRGSLGARMKQGLKSLGSSLVRKIPQYFNLRQLLTRDYWRLTLNGIGFGSALIGYALLTGNGSLQNSFVCVLLFAEFGGALISQRGLIITACNRLLKYLGMPTVERDLVNRLVGGNALGYAAATAWAAYFDKTGAAVYIGAVLLLGCSVLLVLYRIRSKKEVAA